MFRNLGKFKCPKCKKTYKYNPKKIQEYGTDDGRLKCKIPECDYILSEQETCNVLREVILKGL